MLTEADAVDLAATVLERDADAVDLAAAVLEHVSCDNRGKSNVDGKYELHAVASMGNEPIV